MGKWIRRVIMLVLLAVFLYSAGTVAVILYQYHVTDELYADIASKYTGQGGGTSGGPEEADGGQESSGADNGSDTERETAPITVDFEGLRAANADVTGWIYCEDTPINYPVVHGADNDYYLRHSYDGADSASGSIFVEAENSKNFADANTIIYGHHMKNGSMFASLDQWADQEYYEAHSVMWLLTPQQDYKIILLSGYTTAAGSDSYMIFTDSCEEMDAYLAKCREMSDFQADMETDGEARYVLLSTCAYVFDNARYVLHGMLVPVDSAGGVPFSEQ